MSKKKKAVLGTGEETSVEQIGGRATKSEGTGKVAALFSYLKRHALLTAMFCFLVLGSFGAGLKYLDDDAQRQLQNGYLKGGNKERSLLNSINPFLPAPLPDPTPQLSKEYIYAGSRLLAVEDPNAQAAPPADLAVFRPSTGEWWVAGGPGSQQFTTQFGVNGDKPVAGDFDGDGKTDLAVFRPNSNVWYVLKSSDGNFFAVPLGAQNDLTAQADYDGDSRTDIAVYRPSTGVWYINQSSTNTTIYPVFGNSQDVPVPADYDGDGRADIGVWRAAATAFYSLNSSNGQTQFHNVGATSDAPVSADYDGDGRADVATWRSSNATFYIKQSSDNTIVPYQIGVGSDIPVQNDYDGDGKVDVAVWRATESYPGAGDVGKWFIRRSASPSPLRIENWGIAGDKPVPAYYRR